jgi:hypothetical protein
MSLLTIVFLSVAVMWFQLRRDQLAAAERLEAARERVELLNRIQRPEVVPYVPSVAAQLAAPATVEPVAIDDVDGWHEVGTDTSRMPA